MPRKCLMRLKKRSKRFTAGRASLRRHSAACGRNATGCWPGHSCWQRLLGWCCCRTLAGQQRGALGHRIQQGFGFLAVVDLTASQAQGDGTTVSVNKDMDLAREAASGTSHAAIIGPPFFPSHRTGGRGRRWNRPSRSRLRRRRIPQPEAGPTLRLCASGPTGRSRWSRNRSALVSLPMVSLFGTIE